MKRAKRSKGVSSGRTSRPGTPAGVTPADVERLLESARRQPGVAEYLELMDASKRAEDVLRTVRDATAAEPVEAYSSSSSDR